MMKNVFSPGWFRSFSAGLFGLSLLISSMGIQAEVNQAAAIDVLNRYLGSLATGNVQQINGLVSDTMKQSNPQLALNPDYYGEFLRTHYAGVTMQVESVLDKGEVVEARVRFDYPESESTTITFVLGQEQGIWKITEEIF